MTLLKSIDTVRSYRTKIYLAVLFWFGLALFLSLSGMLDYSWAGLPMVMMASLILPIAGFLVWRARSRPFRQYLNSLDIRPLILLHSTRTVGLGFVFLTIYGDLAPVFAYPAGLGDALAAIAALLLGVSLYQSVQQSQTGQALRRVYWWSAFGLADFVVAVSLGVLSRPGVGLFDQAGSTSAMGQFPLSLIPGFIVPLLIITHLIILWNARRQLAGTSVQSEQAPAHEAVAI